MAKAPPCPDRTLKKPLPQHSSLSSREEEGQWAEAKAEYRFREDGQENHEMPGRQ